MEAIESIRGISPSAKGTNSESARELELDLNMPNIAFVFPYLYAVLIQMPQLLLVPGNQSYGWISTHAPAASKPMEDALLEGGFKLDAADLEDGGPLARTTARYKRLLATSHGLTEVSRMLAISENDVLQRLTDRTLSGVQGHDGWNILGFQFEGNRLLPGLEQVLPLLHEELHPVAVYNWFTNPNPDLTIQGESVSPRQWLLSGRSAARVARIAIDV